MSDYIHSDLIPNILGRLPVDDAVRCTSVCKSWYDLITSSSFISLHLKLTNPTQENRLLVNFLAKESNVVKYHCKIHRDNRRFDEIDELECPSIGAFRIIGSVNGLLCLFSSFRNRVVLWNPSVRRSCMLKDSGINSAKTTRFGFGYLPETNDYKIVRLLLSNRKNDLIEVDVYEFSTNSWRNVSVPRVSYMRLNDKPAGFCNGSHHWGVRSGKFGTLIVKFDMKNENLGALSVPKCLDNGFSDFDVSVYNESVCLINMTDSRCDIWVMNEYGVQDSWTMQFRIDMGDHGVSRFLCFRENGEILVETSQAVFCRRLVSYDPTSNQVMNIGEFETKSSYHVSTYVESLMLIKCSNQVF